MPVVQKARRTVGLNPISGAKLTAADTPESLGAGVKQAQAGAWGAVSNAAANLGDQFVRYSNEIATRERNKANEVALLEATNKLDQWELSTLHDPQTGALAQRGKNSFDLPEKVDDSFRSVAGDIEKGLANDDQRLAFEKLKTQRGQAVALTVRRHVAGEVKAFDAQELDASLRNSVSIASAHALDPTRRTEAINRGEDEIIKAANRNGDGPEVYERQVEAFHTVAHTAVIENLLASDHSAQAEAYYKDHKDQIDGAKQADLEAKIDTGTTAKKARTASDRIWAEMGPKNDQQPIDLAAMEDKARALFPDDEKALKAAMLNLRERKAAVDASRADRKDATAGALWGAVAKGATLKQVQAMPEYLAAPGHLQAQISEHIVDQQEQAANRAYTRGQRAEAAISREENRKERAGWAEMWRIENPAVLSKMTDDQILALTPSLGIEHVNRLMTKRRALSTSEAAVHAATIDDDLFKTTAQDAGLNAYGTLNDEQKADLGRLRNVVESQIDAEQRAGGKALTRERKQTIMKGIVDQQVMLNVWGTDPAKIAATVVNPAERAKAYVPQEKIPPQAFGQYANYIRSVSRAAQTMTDQQIAATFGDRIQRAYARRLLGGTRAEIEGIITGAED